MNTQISTNEVKDTFVFLNLNILLNAVRPSHRRFLAKDMILFFLMNE